MKTTSILNESSWEGKDGHTREAGLRVWRSFLPQIAGYGARRNFVDESCSTVSRLSPWMNLGLLSEEELSRDALTKHSFSEVEKFLQEVYWRRYWRGYLAHRPQIWSAYRERLSELQENADHQAFLQKLLEGDSSVSIMSYFAQQLVETGYMHNHARMWFAAWWVHVEKQPWELGADFFLRHLLDGDPAVNTLSWRWVAGLHTKGKHYLARRSNLEKYLSLELLQRYASGIELLTDPQPYLPESYQEVPITGEVTKGGMSTSLSPDIDTLVAFTDHLGMGQVCDQLASQGVQILNIHLIDVPNVGEEFSAKKQAWRRRVWDHVKVEQAIKGRQVLVHRDLGSYFQSPAFNKPFLLSQPEVGYHTPLYEELCSDENAVSYSSPEVAQLNTFAKSGFFTFWKKTKRHLFADA